MSKSKYFILEDFLNENIKDWNTKSLVVFLAAPRNIGKSYSAWLLAENKYLRPNDKMAYMRILDTQLQLPKKEFNNRFKDKFIVSGDVIYSIDKELYENKKGEKIEVKKKNNIVGYFLSINNYINAKSNSFDDVNYIFIDEIIEDSNNIIGIYAKLTNLLTTIIRNKKRVLVVLIANRDTANNEFMIKWGIEPRDTDLDNDLIYQVSENIYYVELGDKWYKNLNNEKTLFHEFAQFDKASKKQLSGGYAKDFSRIVKNYDRWIKNTFKPKFSIAINKQKYTVGNVRINNDDIFAIVSEDNFFDYNIPNYAFDIISGLDITNSILNNDDINELWEMIYYKIRNRQVIYDSFDTMAIIEQTIQIRFKLQQK